MTKILHKELCDCLIGIAIAVQKELGVGFLEKVYENALTIALQDAGLKVEQQKSTEVKFRNRVVGEYYADLIVEGKIILELKAVEAIHTNHKAQLINYLKATIYKVGYLINFSKSPLDFKRLAVK